MNTPPSRWRSVARVGSSLLLATTTLATIASGRTRELYFSSDDLYLPTLYEDLFHWGGHFDAWSLTPAPYVFPDMLVYFCLRPLLRSIEWAQYVSAFVHLAFYTWAARRVLRRVAPGEAVGCELAGPIVLGWLGLYVTGALPLFDALVHPTNHGGGAWWSLIVLGACLTPPRRALRTSGVCALCLAAGFSDPVFASSCGLPLWALALAFALSKQARPALCSGLVGACAILGAVLLRASRPGTLATVHDRSISASWQSLLLMAADLSGPAWTSGIWLGASALLAVAVLIPRGRCPERVRWFALWQLASVLCAVGATAWSGLYSGSGELRYVIVPFCSAPIFMGAVVQAWLAGRSSAVRERLEGALGALVLVASVALLPGQLLQIARGEYHTRWRALAACVRDLADAEQCDTVLSGYWQAKPLMLFSPRRIKVLQMHSTLKSPYIWINSVGWYEGDHQVAAIVTNDLQTPAIERRFGPPELRTRCEDLGLFVYRGPARERLNKTLRPRLASAHRP